MKTIGIIAKKNRPEVLELIKSFILRLDKKGLKIILEKDLSVTGNIFKVAERENIPEHADLLIVFGGDGTLLSVARLPGAENVPILAVNLGGLGFLTETRGDEINQVLEKVLEGDYAIDRRMMLEATLRAHDTKPDTSFRALNDIVINKGALARIMDLDTSVNGNFLNTFKSDGLIICTPTGSTGYSLSAGGPIIYPSLNLISLTPICPHTLTNRPIILPDDSIISVTLRSESEDVFLTIDGQVGIRICKGDPIEIKKSPKTISLIRTPFRSYFEILKQKLKWGER
ncbi:MAG: NAD(+)/NADH kinase [Pseudomonadota bacterium]